MPVSAPAMAASQSTPLPRNFIFRSAEQPRNALSPTEVTLPAMLTRSSAVQSRKALSPTEVMPCETMATVTLSR